MALNKSLSVVIKAEDKTKEALKSISSNVNALKNNFESVKNATTSLKNSFMGIAAAVGVFKLAGEAVEGLKNQMQQLSNIKDIVDNFDSAVVSVNTLTDVYKVNGLGASELKKHMEKLSESIGNAFGDEKQLEKFKDLGITLEDLKTKDVASVFVKLQENVSKLNKSEGLSKLKDIFGKGALDVMDMALDESFGRIAARNKAFEETNRLALQANDDLNRSIDELKSLSDIFFNQMVADYAPAVTVLIKTLIEAYDATNDYGQKQEEVTQSEGWIELAVSMADFINKAYIGIESIIRTFTILIDTIKLVGATLNGISEPFQLLGKSILATFTNIIFAIRNSWEAVKNLDFKGALDAFSNAGKNIVTNFANIPKETAKNFDFIQKKYNDIKTNLEKPIDVPFDLAKVRDNAKKYSEELQKNANLIPPVPDKPRPSSGGSSKDSKDSKDNAISEQYKAAMDYLNAFINEEKRIMAERQKYLDLDRQYNLISDEDYYAQKQKLLEENTAKQIEALNAELALVQQKQEMSKTDKDRNDALKQEYDIKQKINELESDLKFETKKIELELQKEKVTNLNEEIQAINKKYDLQVKFIELNSTLNEGEKIEAINELREDENKELENKIALLEQIAKLSKDPKERQAIQDTIATLKIGIEESKKAVTAFSDDFNAGIKDNFKGFIKDSIIDINNMGDAFDNVIENISNKLLDLAINDIFSGTDNFSSILGGIFGGGGSSGGGGGFDFGSIFSGIGSLLGFANGGVTPTNQPFLVGEKGPELMFLNKSSYVANNADTQKMLGGGGGTTNVTVNVQATDLNSFKNSEQQIAAQMQLALKKANRNL